MSFRSSLSLCAITLLLLLAGTQATKASDPRWSSEARKFPSPWGEQTVSLEFRDATLSQVILQWHEALTKAAPANKPPPLVYIRASVAANGNLPGRQPGMTDKIEALTAAEALDRICALSGTWWRYADGFLYIEPLSSKVPPRP